MTVGGRPVPPTFRLFWIFDAGHVTVTDEAGEQMSRRPYAIDPGKDPPTVVIKAVPAEGEADRMGRYEAKDQALRLNLTMTGSPPKSRDDGVVLALRRAPEK